MIEDELSIRNKTQVKAEHPKPGNRDWDRGSSEFRVPGSAFETPPSSKQKILIVDDRPENLLALERVLRETGAEMIGATSGNEALKATLHHDFALAILDVQMPDMDGYELAEYIRSEEKTRNLPIIFLTAFYSDEHYVFRGYESGAVDFITKPYRPEIMRAKVNIFLQLDRQKRQLIHTQNELKRLNEQLEQKVKERTERIHHLNSVLQAIRSVNQLIVREKDRNRLIKNGCECLISTRGYSSAWIALIDESGKLVNAAEAGLGGEFLPLLERLKRAEIVECGQRALTQSRVIAVGHPQSTCTDCPLAKNSHVKGAMTVRLEHAGTIYGLLSISIPRDLAGDEEEVSLFEEVAGDIAFCLYGIELEIERKRARDALKASEEKYRTLYESSKDGIAFSDMEGNMVDANQAFLDMVGYTGEEIWRLSHHELTPLKWRNMEEKILQDQILKRGYSDEYEKEYIRKDGSAFPVALRVWLTKDEQGTPNGMWEVVRDMTEHKLMEQHRIMTEKMSALGTMTAGVAHELNNPMMGMINFIQYCLKKTPENDPRYSVLKDTERETERCIEIVKHLLTFSRIEPGGDEKFQKEDIATVLDRVLRLLSYRIEKENVSVSRHVAKGAPAIPMIASGIQQMFLNLIGNALDAIGQNNQKEIHIDSQSVGQFLNVTLVDTGCGIPPENLQKIFDPFFTTKPVGKGTGLGLSVSRSIVEAHGGEISCESEVGKGTTFRVLLPIRRIDD